MSDIAQYESQLIGAVILEGALAQLLGDKLNPSDFAAPNHQTAWGSIQRLWRQGRPVDLVTVSDDSGLPIAMLAEYGREAYTTNADSVATWADIIRQKARLGHLIGALSGLVGKAQEQDADADTIAAEAREILLSTEKDNTEKKRSTRQILDDRLKALDARLCGEEDAVGLRTGLSEVDSLIYGLKPSELVLLAARPAMGKSALALQIAQHAACSNGKRVAVFNLEMDEDEMLDRMLIQRGKFPADWYAKPEGHEDDLPRLTAAVNSLKEADLHLFDSIFDIEGIAAKCRRLHQRGSLDLVVVDYLQLISSRTQNRFQNRTAEVGEYSRALKMLAMSLGCPVLALSQLNRDVEKRPDKRPLMADLRESGSLEQDANKILMLYRDEIYNEQSDAKGVAEIIVRKHRGGPIGTVHTAANMRIYSFSDLASHGQQQAAQTAREAIYDPFA